MPENQGNVAQVVEKARARLGELRLGKALHYRNLTLFPITGQNGHDPLYLLLQEAIEAQSAQVSEVSQDGSVPTLRLENRGTMPLLIPEGEILVGAKQNRVVNVTVIVAAGTSFTLPVSCVEAGRWHSVSSHFTSAYFATPRLRADKVRSIQREGRAEAYSDQGQVWQNVSEVLGDLKVNSGTSSLTDAYEARRDVAQEYREKLALPEDALGVLVSSGNQVLGLDLFDCPATLRKLWVRLSQAYFLEAARDERKRRATARKVAEEFLARIPAHLRRSARQMGAGTELDVQGPDIVGNAVWFDDKLCHVSAFAAASADATE